MIFLKDKYLFLDPKLGWTLDTGLARLNPGQASVYD